MMTVDDNKSNGLIDEEGPAMAFHARSALIMLVASVAIYGTFFWRALSAPSAALDGKVFGTDFVVMFVALIILAAVSHIGAAIYLKIRYGEVDDVFDVRDADIERKSDQLSGYVNHFGLIAVLAMVLMDVDRFYLAHSLLGVMVLNLIVQLSVKLWLYGRGA